MKKPGREDIKKIKIGIKRKEGCEDLPLPSYATSGSSGMDLFADCDGEINLEPGDIKLVSTGIYVSIPVGFEAEIRPRSGLAIKHGIGLLNSPGTVDSDYRGKLCVILINLGKHPYVVKRGDRIAQMVIKEVVRAQIEVEEDLAPTIRNEGGFGHTGR